MTKGEMGLKRTFEIEGFKERYVDLCLSLDDFCYQMQRLGYKIKRKPKKIEKLFDMLFDSFPEKKFIDEDIFIRAIEMIKELEDIGGGMNKYAEQIGGDFGRFSFLHFVDLAIDILSVATYDKYITPREVDNICEFICEGGFSYWLTENPENEIVIDTPAKLYKYLKEGYDEIED